MTFATTSFRALSRSGRLVEVKVSPSPMWRFTFTDDGDVLALRGPVRDAARDRIRAALVTSGLCSRVHPAHVHVEGARYWEGFDLPVALAVGAPDRLCDGLLGSLRTADGIVSPVTYELTEVRAPVEDLAELAPPRIDAIARSAVAS